MFKRDTKDLKKLDVPLGISSLEKENPEAYCQAVRNLSSGKGYLTVLKTRLLTLWRSWC